jgi:chromosome segregation ATPase
LTTSRDSLAAEQARTRERQESAEALAGRLREAETVLSDEQARRGALQVRVSELEADLAAEQARTRELQESAEALAGRLREAEAMLSDEQERRGALQDRVRELEAQLADMRAHSASADPPEELQARVVGLQVDLERTLEANGRLREEMDGLLRFLDELSEVLPPPGAAQSPVRQSERA